MQCVTRRSLVTSKTTELRAGDCIITRSGTRALITEIRQRFDDAFPVSNLSILGHHNYAVGEIGVLVHNESVCDETIVELREISAKEKCEDKIRDWLRSQTDKDGNSLYNDNDIDDALKEILWPSNPPSDRQSMSKDAVLKRMGAVAEGKGWRKALTDGERGIASPDRKNVNTAEFDYATFDPKTGRIKIYDSKYRFSRSYPKSIAPKKHAAWKQELRDNLEKEYTGDDRDELLRILDAGQVDSDIFGWPSHNCLGQIAARRKASNNDSQRFRE